MRRILALLIAVSSVVMVAGSVAQATRTTIDLRTGPLVNSGDVSNLALLLSVEFPTVGAAYKNRAAGYITNKKYLGYYNSNSCYGYRGTSTNGYFEPTGPTDTNYYCDGTKFSGNFLNFVNTSSVDIMRLALTGGDRFTDEAGSGLTILQRAILPSDTSGTRNTNFYDGDSGYSAGSNNWGKLVIPQSSTLTALVTPFRNNRPVVVKSCKDEIYFGTVDEGSCADPEDNANLAMARLDAPASNVTGKFKARVLVCSATEGPNRPDLCKKQPNNFYKPVGEIQNNAEKVRVGAFGYLIDSATWGTGTENTRYGGVLRAPMKFAGPNQKSTTGVVSTNAQKEWDETTGVFVAKPLNTVSETGFTHTGVINYINRFGRLTTGVDIYKRRDPVGELFYEALRYFQGQQPTSSAVSATTTTLLGGYPMYSNWTDPMQTACQRNYAMVIADNNTNNDGNLPGATGSEARSADSLTGTAPDGSSKTVTFNADTWAKVVSSFETNGTVTYVDSQGVTRTANGNAASGATGVQSGAPYSTVATNANGSGGRHIYAGATYWANTQQIRPDKPSARLRTFVIDVDEGGNGTLDRSRHLYMAGKYGSFTDMGADGSYATGEGNPFRTYVGGTLTTSQTEWLAADGSTSPAGYFLASQPERLIAAIKKIFAEASKPTGNLSGGSLNVSRLSATSQSGAFYRSVPSVSDSSGTVIRTELTFNTSTMQLEVGTARTWDAANILTGIQAGTTTLAPLPTPANRKIFSYSRTSAAGVTFTWSNVDTAVQTSLKTDPATSTVEADLQGQRRLDYIRGDRSNETVFRARNLIMGDIINSAPVLKAGANSEILDTSYQSFFTSNKNRTATLYVGANDGMLHAFQAADDRTNTSNGRELFAYVPRAVSTKLNKLTDPAYAKDAYVDGSLVVDEARFYRPSSSGLAWGTVLAGGMGGGAQGVYALDVTDPTAFGTSSVLWEFTDADDADMGNLVAEPRIVKLAVNGSSATTPTYKWFVMVTSGYNNYRVDGSQSSTGKQALFLLSLEKAPGDAWALNTNYYKIVADDATFTSTTLATGMGMPGAALGSKGNVEAAYAGDLQGNLWKFDLTGGAGTWTGSARASILFIATAPDLTTRQPITVAPLTTLHPLGGYQLIFGTGKFLEPNDGLSTAAAQQTMYGVWDAADGRTVRRNTTGSASATVNGLVSRTIAAATTTTTAALTGVEIFYGTSTANPPTNHRGWYADFSGTSERIAVDPTLFRGVAALNSSIPGGDPCVGAGNFNQYRLNPVSGISFPSTIISTSPSVTSNVVGAGYVGSAVGLAEGDATWSGRDASGRYVVSDTIVTISAGANGVNSARTTVSKAAGRMSWREIKNFQ